MKINDKQIEQLNLPKFSMSEVMNELKEKINDERKRTISHDKDNGDEDSSDSGSDSD